MDAVGSEIFRTFATDMYKLMDFLTSVIGMPQDDVVSDEMYCTESNTV